MKLRCLACGALKDTAVGEIYPYPDDQIVDDEPITPLWVLDCQGPMLTISTDGRTSTSDWRVVIVCHHCLHRLQPDLWISEACWKALQPLTPFAQLPRPVDDKSNPGARFVVEAYAPHWQ